MTDNKKKETIRYKENPFLEDMVIPVKTKRVRLSPLGKDENVVVNQATGEVHGTHVSTIKKVDANKFVKFFIAGIASMFEMNASGQKALLVLMHAMKEKVNADQVILDEYAFKKFIEETETEKYSLPTFHRGIAELESHKVIAKTMRKGWYFINPNFVFNGDRIAFTTIIEKRSAQVRAEDSVEQIDSAKLKNERV